MFAWFDLFTLKRGGWSVVKPSAFDVEHGLWKARRRPPWL